MEDGKSLCIATTKTINVINILLLNPKTQQLQGRKLTLSQPKPGHLGSVLSHLCGLPGLVVY